MSNIDRRAALKLIAAGVLAERLAEAQHHLETIARAPGAYKLQFFTPAQNALLDQLSELIIPADGRSPGAREAKVSLFIDLMVANSRKDVQQQWISGLQAVESEAKNRFRNRFLDCNAGQQDQILRAMAANENKPANDLERFFAALKLMTINGYYTSPVGIHKDLQYIGNTAQVDFPGCAAPEQRG
ncbi:MAG TPA: gluconate 2-dehydrogenase subunit 3 family protein [Bryobacterales bacterium]|jgi:hypothetical protein|nr:gluconate 2-dehydrogenase subunit 3 family protein [Bryobacterales bacterium]